jgi:formylglycine-generating enzyme required for sulfatase activity
VGASDPGSGQAPLGLVNVYVDLDTKTQVEAIQGQKVEQGQLVVQKETRPLTVLEAVLLKPRVVLLGDPGSGKSTFVNVLAHVLCNDALYPKGNWLEHLPGWPQEDGRLTPILIVLRDFARVLPDPLPDQAEPAHLWSFIQIRLDAQRLNKAAEPLHDLLEKGKCLLLLDGLDEMPNQPLRLFMRDAVRVFLKRYPGNRALITCRVLSYQPPQKQNQPDLRLTEVTYFELAPFDEKKIHRFVEGWYTELGRLGTLPLEEVPVMISRLQQAVERPDLQRLAPNPLLLTVMALVHSHKGRLPDARALLYEETVDILLWRWEQVKMGGREETSQLRKLLLEAGRTDVDLKRVLWEIAFQCHSGSNVDNNESLADIGELRLQRALADLNKDDLNWAQQIIETIKVRAGLLIERVPEVFTFPHRTFQEYFAGAYLASQSNFARSASELARQGILWREVILLATGKLVYLSGDVDRPLALVGELCPEKLEDDPLAWQKAWLAGDVLQEIGMNRVMDTNLGRDLHARVQMRLVQIIEGGKLAAQERARAGTTLSVLGDPRFDANRWHLPSEEMLGFVRIPAGKFLMGSDPKVDPRAYDEEQPQNGLNIPYDYYMARYPVTVAQYQLFVEQSGYKTSNEYSLKGIPNHPVVDVTFYDALEYCKWLDQKLKEMSAQKTRNNQNKNQLTFWHGLAEHKLHVTLPSEAEWEKAARGTDGRIYPWGNEFDLNKANVDDTGIGSPSAVGCFPSGAGPYGVLDTSGNVHEWTRSLWGKDISKPEFKYPYELEKKREDMNASRDIQRVLRGGSYGNEYWYGRCALRSSNNPDKRIYILGFRIVVSPMVLS